MTIRVLLCALERWLPATCFAVATCLSGHSVLAQTVTSDTLRIGMSAEVTAMDPHFAALAPNVATATHIFETLTRVDADARLIPGLAESWRAVNERTWEFKLRPGIRFHDGRPLRAEDVLFSLDQPKSIKNSPGGFASYVKAIVGKEAIDDVTLRLTTAAPYALLPYDLASIFIVSKDAAQHASSEDFNRGTATVGTGPFRLQRFVRGERIELARHDGYWGQVPVWRRVQLRMIPSDPARIAALLARDVDVIEHVPTADLLRLSQASRWHIERKVSWRTIYLTLAQQSAPRAELRDHRDRPLSVNPLADRRVRLAISHAIDRDAIVRRVMDGLAIPAANIVSPGVFGHVVALRPLPYDPERAKRLLAEAGFPQGFRMSLHAPNNRYVNDEIVAQAVAQMLARIGIEVKVEAMPANLYFPRARQGQFAMAMLGWGSFSADLALRALLATEDPARGMGTWNWGRYGNPKVDASLQRALESMSEDQRRAAIESAVVQAMEDVALIPLHHQEVSWAMRPGLTYRPRTDEFTLAHEIVSTQPARVPKPSEP